MYKVNGAEQVVKYLKAAQLALQKSIGKDKISSMRELDPKLIRSKLTGFGLPVIIPSRDRKLIAGGSESIIRFWLTIFSIYRVIGIPGKLKLETIVAPSSAPDGYLDVVKQFNSFLRESSVSSMFNTRLLFRRANIRFLEAASATQKVSWSGLFSDPQLLKCLGLIGYARNILLLIQQPELVVFLDTLMALDKTTLSREIRSGHTEFGFKDHLDLQKAFANASIMSPDSKFAGKLSTKLEAAGKLRVFAMVTAWDQTVLGPIHDMLFAFLRGLPNDGTFDQHSSEVRARSKSINSGRSFGYDLSAATDRLPINIQSALLDLIVPDLGANWSLLLTKRDYYLKVPDESLEELGFPKNTTGYHKLAANGWQAPNEISFEGNPVPVHYDVYETMGGSLKIRPYLILRYKVGQPMGALSSWAMLAVTHHMIVQYCYRLSYNVPMGLPWTKDTWYTNYEVLGDDIILFDPTVAKAYLKIMESLGVPINTSKSVCATVPVTEYAKVTSLMGKNVSALSWKMFMSGNSLMGRVNIIYSLLSKGVISKKNIIPWIHRSAALGPHNPGSINPTMIALWTMLSNKGLLPLEECLKALIDGKEKVFRFAKAILYNADINKITLALPSLIADGKLFLYENKRVKIIWSFELPWMKITMWKPLAVFQAKRDIDNDSMELSKSMFLILMSKIGFNDEEYILKNHCAFELEFGEPHSEGFVEANPGPDSTEDNDYKVLFASFFSIVREKADKLGGVDSISNLEMDSSIPDLVVGNEKLSRYNELLQIVTRYKDKLDPNKEVLPARVVKPTELKMLQLISKMGNRPAFTTAVNAF